MGITLGSDGALSGSARICGSFPFIVKVSDSSSVPTTTQKEFSLVVTCANDYVISGTTGVANTVVTLTGAANRTTTSGAGGDYSFNNLTNGYYTVTPLMSGFSFIPTSRSVMIIYQDAIVSAFTAGHQLEVTMIGTGGSINSSPVGIHCTGGTCTATYTPATPVKLTQITDGVFFFTTWGGACSGNGNTCDVDMTIDKTVTATYTAAPRAQIGSAEYSTLKAACDVAPTSGVTTILTLDALFTESLTVNKQLIIVGGHNITYTGRTGQPTELKGTLTIGTGILIVDGLAVR